MAITAAPRPRTRSTVRLVSVVVPLWLMATTSVSLMSWRMPKPRSSVAVIGIDVELAVGERVEHGRHAAPGDRRGALADDLDPGDARRRPAGRAIVGGQGARADRRRGSSPSRSTILPRSVLRKLAGASVISFSR